MSELTALDATGQAELVRRGDVKPAELVEAAIARIEAVDPELNAVVTPMFEDALERARGELPEGPFAGVPYLLKDFGEVEVAGVRFTEGSGFLADFVPPHGRRDGPAPATGRVRDLREDQHAGVRHPPHDRGGLPRGGAEPLGYVPLTGRLERRLGRGRGRSDGAGGLRQRRGRVDPDPRVLLRALRAQADPSPEHHGAQVRGVRRRDRGGACAHGLRSRLGPHPRRDLWSGPGRPLDGPTSVPPVRRGGRGRPGTAADRIHGRGADGRPRGRRLPARRRGDRRAPRGARAPGLGAPDPGGRRTADRCLHHRVGVGDGLGLPPLEPTDGPRDGPGRCRAVDVGTQGDGRGAHQRRLPRGVGDPPPPLPRLRRTLRRRGRRPDADDRRGPPPLGEFDSTPEDPLRGMMRAASLVPFTPIANIAGHPAMSVPLRWSADGLPIGSQVIGRFGDEATLFRLAAQLEEARPWAGRRPPVHAS